MALAVLIFSEGFGSNDHYLSIGHLYKEAKLKQLFLNKYIAYY